MPVALSDVRIVLARYSFKDGLFTVNTDNPAWQVAHRILISPFSVRGAVRGGVLGSW